MKKIIIMLVLAASTFAADYSQYSSNFGLGVGLGFPTGYELKAIYRQSEWLSLSLNYNIFQIKNVSYDINDGGTDLNISGDFVFSTPGVMAHIHPLGENFRISAGFLWDRGGFDVDLAGDVAIDTNPVDVSGYATFDLGETYPYIGVGYGYSFNSTVHLDFAAGVYLVQAPEIELYLTTSDIDTVLNDLGVTDPTEVAQIKEELAKVDNNILDLPSIYEDIIGVDLDMPSSSELEQMLVDGVQEAYDYLPKIGDYNIIPVVSFGFTVFMF